MADIDVQAIGLASPPASAYQQEYTPGILVRNNGVAGAVATGYLQLYDKDSGVLLVSWPVSSGEIPPGAQGTATSNDTLDLSGFDPGTLLMFAGNVTTPNDQVPSNNPLQPVTVTVLEGTSPEPPTVPAHSDQHEQGGADELDLDGMRGLLSTPQSPKDHKANHEEGGDDEIDVTGLHGQLADAQPVQAHGNERHTSQFLTAFALAEHETGTTEHAAATNLEKSANKGQPNGYCPLDGTGFVAPASLAPGIVGMDSAVLHGNQVWSAPEPATGTPGRLALGVAPFNAASQPGEPALYSPSGHNHSQHGPIHRSCIDYLYAPAETTILDATIAPGWATGRALSCWIDVWGKVDDPEATEALEFRVYLDNSVLLGLLTLTTGTGTANQTFRVTGKVGSFENFYFFTQLQGWLHEPLLPPGLQDFQMPLPRTVAYVEPGGGFSIQYKVWHPRPMTHLHSTLCAMWQEDNS